MTKTILSISHKAGIKTVFSSSYRWTVVNTLHLLILLSLFSAEIGGAQTFQFTFGSPGSRDGQFFGPTGVAVDGSGNIYVADTENHRIQKFGANGEFLLTFGTQGSSDGQFDVSVTPTSSSSSRASANISVSPHSTPPPGNHQPGR